MTPEQIERLRAWHQWVFTLRGIEEEREWHMFVMGSFGAARYFLGISTSENIYALNSLKKLYVDGRLISEIKEEV